MKQNLNGMNAFLKSGCIVTSIISLSMYTFLRIIFWGMPFEVLEEISIPLKAALCGNILFVVSVFSFLLLERTLLYIGRVVVPDLLLLFKRQAETSTAKKELASINNTYSIKNTIVYDELLVEEF